MKEFIYLQSVTHPFYSRTVYFDTYSYSCNKRGRAAFCPGTYFMVADFTGFALNTFKSGISVLIVSAPLLIAVLLPIFGFDGIRDNHHNPNLLDPNYYRVFVFYLIIAITLLVKIKLSS